MVNFSIQQNFCIYSAAGAASAGSSAAAAAATASPETWAFVTDSAGDVLLLWKNKKRVIFKFV